MNAYQQIIWQMIRDVQDDNSDVINIMPNEAKTKEQRRLKRLHGTPRAFARACIAAIGEISVLEAHTAITEYHDEWKAAERQACSKEAKP